MSLIRTGRPGGAAAWGSLVVAAVVAALAPTAAATSLTPEEARRLGARTNDAIGLVRSDVVVIDLDTRPGIAQRISVAIEASSYRLDLWPHSVRADGYQVWASVEGGALVPVDPGPVRTVRGRLVESAGSVVAGAVNEDGLSAAVRLADGSRYWIEPVAAHLPGAPAGAHVVYHDDDVIGSLGRCGTEAAGFGDEAIPPADEADGAPSPLGGAFCAELACDADFPYYEDYGSIGAVENRVNQVINTVNLQYETEVDISHTITAIVVRTSSTYSTNSASGLLDQFRSRWLSQHGDIPRDVAHLFTGRNLSGGTIGIAWGIGEICTNGAYCLSESDCCGSFSCATDLTAHELGHLWNASHCDCTSYTMNPFITCSNQFTTGSEISIIQHRNSRTCLDPGGCIPPTAGACCYADGSCEQTDDVACTSGGGAFAGYGVSCAGADCQEAPAACCFDDGTCIDLILSNCDVAGGLHQGFGSTCAATDCPLGACCFDDGTCAELSGTLCVSVGGTYLGDGSACGSTACSTPSCPGDIDGPLGEPDGVIGFPDLLAVLSQWGPCVGCPADIDGPLGEPDGVVGFPDLLVILSAWGPCE